MPGAPSRSDVSDPELVAAWRAGEERAARDLVTRHTAGLARYLAGLGTPGGELEDVVQETFIKAFGALGSWRGEASFRAWLYRIGANLSRDLYRKSGRRQMVELPERELMDRADPVGELEASEADRRIREGLADLPRMQREVFLLRAQQGMDYAEIAAALKTTPGSARVHYHHAVKHLKGIVS